MTVLTPPAARAVRVVAFGLALLLGGRALRAQAPGRVTSADLTSVTCPGSGCVTLATRDLASVAVQLVGSGSWNAIFEGAVDATPVATFMPLTLTAVPGGPATSTAGVPGLWSGAIAGFTQVRVRLKAYDTGTASVVLSASPAAPPPIVPAAPLVASPAFPARPLCNALLRAASIACQ